MTAPSEGVDKYADGIWLTLGTLQLFLDEADSLDSFETARSLDNADERNSMLLARAHLTLRGHVAFGKALEEAKQAQTPRLDANDPRYDRILALGYLRNETWSDTARYAQAAVAGGDPVSYGYLIAAIAEARLENKTTARDYLTQDRHAWPEEPEPKDYIVHAKQELPWFDTKAELESLLEEAVRLINN